MMLGKASGFLIGATAAKVAFSSLNKDSKTNFDENTTETKDKEGTISMDIIKIKAEDVSIENSNDQFLPQKITDTVSKISELSKKVKDAKDAAGKAAENAKSASSSKTGVFHNTKAIEEIQKSLPDIGNAQVALAEAQDISFKFQKELADATKYLFGLGIANIAMNRTVVRELQLKLEGASKEELNDLARQELMGVISQLKAQEDMMSKTEKNTRIIKEHHKDIGDIKEDVDDIEKNIDDVEENIDEIEDNIDEIEEDIDDIEKNIDDVEENIDDIEDNIDEIEEDIDDIEKNIDEVEEDIDDIEKNIDEVEENIDDIEKNIDEVEEDVEDNKKRIDELFAEIEYLKKNDIEMSKKLLVAKVIAVASAGTSVAGLVLSVLIALGIV